MSNIKDKDNKKSNWRRKKTTCDIKSNELKETEKMAKLARALYG